MPEKLAIDPKRTALLVMDVQSQIVGRYPAAEGGYLATLASAVDAARASGIKVIYVIVLFRKGHPEIAPTNQMFSALKAGGQLIDDKVHPKVAPHDGELVVVKKRVSAFAGSDLQVILSAHDINHLILTGIATSGVVLSTLRQAADLDYRLSVIADCCLDGDAEVHAVLTGKVFPRQASVMDAEAFITGLK